jgi:hypothetical protein
MKDGDEPPYGPIRTDLNREPGELHGLSPLPCNRYFSLQHLERFKKYCSHSATRTGGAVFLGSNFVSAQSQIVNFQPRVVIVDPITSLMDAGTDSECRGMVTRLVDYLKAGQVTTLFTSLTQGGHALQQSEAAMSSLMDSWLLLQDLEGNGERNRVLYVVRTES